MGLFPEEGTECCGFRLGTAEAGGGWHRADLALLSFSGHQRVNMRCHGETLDKDSLPALIGHIPGVVQMFSDVNLEEADLNSGTF